MLSDNHILILYWIIGQKSCITLIVLKEFFLSFENKNQTTYENLKIRNHIIFLIILFGMLLTFF